MNKQAIRILSLALVLAASSPVVFAQKVWKGSWATAVEWTGKGDMPKESLFSCSVIFKCCIDNLVSDTEPMAFFPVTSSFLIF